jgi:hypothetical protein
MAHRTVTKVGEINIGVQTSHRERVSALIRAVLIAGGIALTIAGAPAPAVEELQTNGAPSSGKQKGHPLKMRNARSVRIRV